MNGVIQRILIIVLLLQLSTLIFAARRRSKVCPPFPFADLEHGNITITGSHKYAFRCDRGYFLTSPSYVRCWRGKWSSNRQPKCSRSEGFCGDPPSIESGETLGDERQVGSVVQYMCKPGHVLLGDGKRFCLRSGHWSGLTPSCMDETEPVQKVAQRLKNKFVGDIGSFSTDSVIPEGRLLDSDSVKLGLELIILIDRSSSVDPKDFKIGIGFVKFLFHQFGVRNGKQNSSKLNSCHPVM